MINLVVFLVDVVLFIVFALVILLFARCVADAASVAVIVPLSLLFSFGSCCRFSLLLLRVCSYPLVVPVVLVARKAAKEGFVVELGTAGSKQLCRGPKWQRGIRFISVE